MCVLWCPPSQLTLSYKPSLEGAPYSQQPLEPQTPFTQAVCFEPRCFNFLLPFLNVCMVLFNYFVVFMVRLKSYLPPLTPCLVNADHPITLIAAYFTQMLKTRVVSNCHQAYRALQCSSPYTLNCIDLQCRCKPFIKELYRAGACD